MRKRQAAGGQGSFGFIRAGQLQMIRLAEIPPVKIGEGKRQLTALPRDMIAVLRVLDDHGPQCFPSLETIAAEARIGRSTVTRALKGLTLLDVVCTGKRPLANGGFSNLYSINWTALKILCPPTSTVPQSANHRPTARVPPSHCGTGSAHEAPKNRHPLPPQPETSNDSQLWLAVADKFRSRLFKIDKLAHAARERGELPSDFERRVALAFEWAEHPENSSKIKVSAGAVVAVYLETGAWPIDGIVDPSEEAKLAAQRAGRQRAWDEYTAEYERILDSEKQKAGQPE